MAKPALALLFEAGHEVLVESVLARAGIPHVLLEQQLTTIDSLLGLLHELGCYDSLLAILAPLQSAMPWLLSAMTALRALPTGGSHAYAERERRATQVVAVASDVA
jgi:hypothetical protein